MARKVTKSTEWILAQARRDKARQCVADACTTLAEAERAVTVAFNELDPTDEVAMKTLLGHAVAFLNLYIRIQPKLKRLPAQKVKAARARQHSKRRA